MSRLTTVRPSTRRVRKGKVARRPSSTRSAATSAFSSLLATRSTSGVSRSGRIMLTMHISVPATKSTAAMAVHNVIFMRRRHRGYGARAEEEVLVIVLLVGL